MIEIRIDTGIVLRNKSYKFTVILGRDQNNKQIRKFTTFTPPTGMTRKKADALAKEEYLKFKNRCLGLDEYNENMKFSKLVELYFQVYAPNILKPSTSYNYEKMIAKRFMPFFGNKKLKDINSNVLTTFFNSQKVIKDGVEKPLEPVTVKRIFNIMQSLFTFAVNQGYIKETPCTRVILPRDSVTKEEKRKYLLEEEIPYFLSLFDGYSIMNTIIKTLLFTGLRSGECLALRWSDIDFDKNIIHVRYNLIDEHGKHYLTTPKTKQSKRTIYFSDSLKNILLEHQKHQYELVEKLGDKCLHGEMVFTSDLGNYKDRSSLNTQFRKVLNGTSLEHLTLHCLRHSNATLLLNSGVDLKVISEHLGHSSISTTANCYVDVLESLKQKTASTIDEILTYTPNIQPLNTKRTPNNQNILN